MINPLDPLIAVIWKVIIDAEGEFSNDPDDPGGPTKWGVSLRYLKKFRKKHKALFVELFGDDEEPDIEDIKALSLTDAYRIFTTDFFIPTYILQDAPTMPGLQLMVVDTAYNMGTRQAIRILQSALLVLTGDRSIKVDGLLGPITRNALATVALTGASDRAKLLETYSLTRKRYYDKIIERYPTLGKYRKGWLNRVKAVKATAKTMDKTYDQNN